MDYSRFQNYGLWVAVAALIPLILEAAGLNVLPANYKELVTGILGVLILAGVINNPTSGIGYFDQIAVEVQNVQKPIKKT